MQQRQSQRRAAFATRTQYFQYAGDYSYQTTRRAEACKTASDSDTLLTLARALPTVPESAASSRGFIRANTTWRGDLGDHTG